MLKFATNNILKVESQVSKTKFDNSSRVINLDLSNDKLDVNLMKELLASVSSNEHIGYIKWPNIPKDDKEIQNLKAKIEEKLIANNQNFVFHPTDFIHGLFSSHIYQDVSSGEKVQFSEQSSGYQYNEYLTNWTVQHSYDNYYQNYSGYYGASYVNEQDGHVVLAHRGTAIHFKDMLAEDSPSGDDMVGIVGGNIVKQQEAAYAVTKEVVEYARSQGYYLSITGHSLGGWLAEQSLFYCYKDFGEDLSKNLVKTVVFDSPGSVMQMENAESHVESFDTDFNIKHLDITTYLSRPNPINTINKHAGKVYVVPTEIPAPPTMLKWIAGKSKAEAFTSLLGHSLDLILDTFNSTTGKPTSYKRALDWPKIEADVKKDYAVQQAIDAAVPLGLKTVSKALLIT